METKNIDLSSLKIDRNKKVDGPPKNYKYIFLFLFIVVIALALIFVGNPFKLLTEETIEVETVSVGLQSLSQSNAVLTASGYVVAQRKASVASKGTGRLVYLGVVEGDRVKKDQVLARLEDNDIKALLAQAKANLRINEADLSEAQNNYERVKILYDKNLGTKVEVEYAEAKLNKVIASIELAKANVLSAEIALENTLIRAPFDGTVLTKNADVGEIVAPLGASMTSKGAVVTMADMSSLQVEADVSESNIEKISTNQNCEITLDAYPEKTYPGYVAKIVPTANRSKSTVLVKVAFNDYDNSVLPEMSAKVLFLTNDGVKSKTNDKLILSVQSDAIKNRDGKQIVYIVQNQVAKEVVITTGRKFGNYTEIKSGLSSGDKVIIKPSEKIKEGIKIKEKI